MVNDVIRGNSSSRGSVWVLGKAFFPLIEVYPWLSAEVVASASWEVFTPWQDKAVAKLI